MREQLLLLFILHINPQIPFMSEDTYLESFMSKEQPSICLYQWVE